MDWVALGANALHLGYEVQQEFKRTGHDNTEYFDNEWTGLPDALSKLADPLLQRRSIVEEPDKWDVSIWSGNLGDEALFWMDTGGKRVSNLMYQVEREAAVRDALGSVIRASVGSKAIRVSDAGLAANTFNLPNNLLQTPLLTRLDKRVKAFLAAGKHRSYLLSGAPGTGKSLTLATIAASLDRPSLYIEGTAFTGTGDVGLSMLVEALRPEVVIVDDIDRIGMTRYMLEFLEVVHAIAPVTLTSCNYQEWLSRAALRPGRIDDIIEIEALDTAVTRRLLHPDDHDLVEQVYDWPIVFIKDYTERVEVLGRAKARAELQHLAERVKGNEADEDFEKVS